jgi:WD40 repeat protein
MDLTPTNPLPQEEFAPTIPLKKVTDRGAPLPRIPGYELQGELGRGGMGVVYQARQKGLNRIVALKVILSGAHADPRTLKRFQAEAEVLARLEHPNIVKIHEVGESEGLPFFCMEFCGEGSLSSRLKGTPLPARQSAALIEPLARAMHAAHEAGIVHRDLKPGNILLAGIREEGKGTGEQHSSPVPFSSSHVPKITDFGIAKQLEGDSKVTRTGAVLGTPEYMAPEQAAGMAKAVGPAADIYSLGAILYECLTGRPPFCGAIVAETLLQVKTLEPVPPSHLLPAMPRDLNTICLKCLEKYPARRYGSARALAEDLERFLKGEPILARPAGFLERAVKWIRRRPAIAALLATIVVLLILGASGITWAYREAIRERREALLQRDAAESARSQAEHERNNALVQQENAEHSLAMKTLLAAQASWRESNAGEARRHLEDVPEHRRGWEWGVLRRQFDGGLLTLHGHNFPVTALALHPDGQQLASISSSDNLLIRWDLRTGELLQRISLIRLDTINDLAFSPDGRTLALALGSPGAPRDGVILWDFEHDQIVRRFSMDGAGAACVAISPDGKRLAAGPIWKLDAPPRAADIVLWDVKTGKRLKTLVGHQKGVNRVVFRPDGRLLASAGADWTARLWDIEGKGAPVVISGHLQDVVDRGERELRPGVRGLAFRPDGRWLASGGQGDVRVWGLAEGRELGRMLGDSQGITAVAYRPDGMEVAATGLSGLLQVTAAGRVTRTLRGHIGEALGLTYLADGHHLVSAGRDGTLKVWDTRTRPSVPILSGPRQKIRALACARDSRRVLAVAGSELWSWDSYTGRVEWTRAEPQKELLSLAVSPHRSLIATGSSGGMVQMRDAVTGRVLRELPGHREDVVGLAFSGDGQVLAAASSDEQGGELRLWEAATGELIRTHPVPENVLSEVAIDPRGKQVALVAEGQVRLWDLADGRPLMSLLSPGGSSFGVAFSSDGKHIASGSWARTLTVWDTDKGQARHVLHGHGQPITSVAFTRDRNRLASCSTDGAVRIWEVRDGQLLATLLAHNHAMRALAFTPDGRTLAVACWAYGRPSILLWDAGPPEGERILRGHRGSVRSAIFSPDGRLLASIGTDNTVRIWEAASGRLLHQIQTANSTGYLVFSRDSKQLLGHLPGGGRAWEVETGRPFDVVPKDFRAAPNPSRRSPDGRFFAEIEGDLIRLVRMTPDECEQGRCRIVLQEDASWHSDEATRLEGLKQHFAASFHLERLALLSPWDAGLWLRLGRACARSGQNDRAAVCFLRAIFANAQKLP